MKNTCITTSHDFAECFIPPERLKGAIYGGFKFNKYGFYYIMGEIKMIVDMREYNQMKYFRGMQKELFELYKIVNDKIVNSKYDSVWLTENLMGLLEMIKEDIENGEV